MLRRVCLVLLCFAAMLPAHLLPIKVYTTTNGMPRNSARCMTSDSNGMLWICTSEGLVRFDGYQFRVFGPEHGLPSRSIYDFVLSRKGGYWVVSDAGLCRLPAGSKIGDRCRPLEMQGPTGDFQPDCLVESPDGRTWVATSKALFQVSADGRKLEPTPLHALDIHDNLQSLALTPDGTVLAVSERALFSWKPGEPPRDISNRFPGFRGGSQVLALPSGDLWVATPWGLYHLAGPSGDVQTIAYPPGHTFGRILFRRDGSMWLAGSEVARVDISGSRLTIAESLSTREGLPGSVFLLAEDRQGNLWGSSDAAGIFRIADSGFKSYSQDDGLASPRIGAIFESLRGDLCVLSTATAGDSYNLAVKNGARFERVRYRPPPGIFYAGWGWNQFGLQAHDGQWWFPTGNGLLRFAATARPQDLDGRAPLSVYNSASPLGQDQIFRLFEDSHGDLWIGTLYPLNTLVRWERATGRFHRWTTADGWLEDRGVISIREASSGTLWIATYGEILRFRRGRFELLPVLPSAQVAMVRDLYIDRAGRVWIATSRYGLYRSDNPEADQPVFRNYTTREGLSSDSVRSLTEDDAGMIYAGTVRSVDRIDPQAPPGAHRIHHFTPDDGVPDSEQNVAFRDRRGHLWFGTFDGLAEFDPAKATPLGPPQIYVTRLRVRGEEIPLPWQGARSLHADLAPNKNQFEIQWAGIDLRSVASVRYQYRLVGLDPDWSQPVENTSVNYASLPSGPLHFEVRALTADGQMGASVTALDLSVQAALWRRWWFLALAGLCVASIVGALLKYRVQHLLAMERLRTRIASDLHDDIGASLTQISILTELARRGDSRDALDDVAGMARELVGDMSDIVWAVNPRHDRFDALAHRMRRFASDTLGDLEIDFDAGRLPADFSLPLELRRPLYLVFKEAAHNVARHSGATRAAIRIELGDAFLKLTVEDNGCGFDPAAVPQGEGIGSIQKRMRDIGGKAWWEPLPGGGTRFTAVLPLPSARNLHRLGGIFARHAR